jgi:hypothetical protein
MIEYQLMRFVKFLCNISGFDSIHFLNKMIVKGFSNNAV